MKMQAQVLSINNNSGTSSKTGKPYNINELFVLDVDSPKPEVHKLMVHENDVQAAKVLVGKTVWIDVFFNSGNFRFGGQVVQSQAKAA